MGAIIRQVKANLRTHKLQAGLILLALCAATTLLTISLSTLYIARGAYDRLFERTRSAHIWLYLSPEFITEQQVES